MSHCRPLILALAAALALAMAVETASAHTISKRAALAKTGKVAKKVAADTGAAYWFAGGCKRRSAHKVVCWGGVANDGEGCIQKVVVTSASHAGRGLRARRSGRSYCGEVPSGSGGGTGGGGGSQVVCAIRQSVCI